MFDVFFSIVLVILLVVLVSVVVWVVFDAFFTDQFEKDAHVLANCSEDFGGMGWFQEAGYPNAAWSMTEEQYQEICLTNRE